MATLNLSTVELVSTLRAAPSNGSPSSQDYNDSWTEALADLASLSGFINDILIPMLDGLVSTIMPNPQGAPNGLEGRYIFSDTSDLTPVFFDVLSNQSLSIADSLRVINGIVSTIQTSINVLNVEVTALQTSLSSTNQNDIAQALQNLAATVQSLQAQVLANTQAIANITITLQTNGVNNDLQNKLNLADGNGIHITQSGGTVTVSLTPPPGVNLVAQAINHPATLLEHIVTAGLYRVDVYIIVSQAASVTSTLPDTRIKYTDQDTGAVITVQATGPLSGNTLSTFAQGTFVVNAKASTDIQFDIGQVTPYASAGIVPMQYVYRARVEPLG